MQTLQNSLPVVSPDIGFSIAQSLADTDDKVLKKELKKIEKENPCIADFIRQWCKLVKGDARLHAAFCGILVYKLLASQAEANQLMEDLRLE